MSELVPSEAGGGHNDSHNLSILQNSYTDMDGVLGQSDFRESKLFEEKQVKISLKSQNLMQKMIKQGAQKLNLNQ